MPTRVCFISQRSFPGDARLSNEIRFLQQAGYEVDIVCTRNPGQSSYDTFEGIRIYRLPSLPRMRASKIRYFAEYFSFLVPAMLFMVYLQMRRQYRAIQVTNLPDPLIFSALFPKLVGAKVLFDFREMTPEMMDDRFNFAWDSSFMKLVIFLEQLAIRFSDMSLTTHELMRRALIKRGADPNKVGIMLNLGAVQLLDIAKPYLPHNPDAENDGTFRLVMHGTVLKRYGYDVLIAAIKKVVQQAPQVRMEIIGGGNQLPDVQQMIADSGMGEYIKTLGHLNYDKLIPRILRAHVGVINLRLTTETRISQTHKMYEYIQLGIPIIHPRTDAVCEYFPPETIYYFEQGDVDSLAAAVLDLLEHPEKRKALSQNMTALFESKYSPAHQQAAYVGLFEKVLAKPVRKGSPSTRELSS